MFVFYPRFNQPQTKRVWQAAKPLTLLRSIFNYFNLDQRDGKFRQRYVSANGNQRLHLIFPLIIAFE